MALPFITAYYLAIGTTQTNTGVITELSGGSYARLACAFSGTALTGLTQTVGPWVVATAPTPAVNSYYGMVFDALTGGNMLAYWTWSSPYTGSLTAFPSTTISMVFTGNYAQAINLAVTGGQASSGSLIDAGAQIGTVNGNPMLAGMRLNIGVGGTLSAHTGQGQWIASADIQGTAFVGGLAANSIQNGLTALSGGSVSGANPIMSAFINRITTVAASLDSVILPSVTLAPVGSMLYVMNSSGSNILGVWPDTGSAIGTLSANAVFSVAVKSNCMLTRVSSLLWISTPSVPS